MKYDAITIDTQCVEHNGFNFDGGLLAQLKQFGDGPTQVIVSQIVASEIIRHLQEKTQAAKEALETTFKKAVYYGLKDNALVAFDEAPDVAALVRQRLAKFFEEIGAEIIPVDGVSVRNVVQMYFQSIAPFSATKGKKNEFPDAIALMSIEHWAKENKKRILAVSNDSDWARFAAKSEHIDVVETLSDALEKLQEHTKEAKRIVELLLGDINSGKNANLRDEFEKHLGDAISGYGVYAEADSSYHLEEDYTTLSFRGFELPEDFQYYVVQAGPNKIVASVDLTAVVNAEAWFGLSVWDSIDREYVSMGSTSATKEDEEIEVTILVTFTGDFKTDDISVEAVEITDGPSSIDFGNVEPDYSGDEEPEEPGNDDDPLPEVF